MSDLIVEPKPGVFTFVGEDGDSLRDVVMTLNDQWSFYMVRRVGDDAQLEGLEKTLADVKENGVDRGTMVTVEALGLGELHDYYPSSSYTLRRSKTNQKIALEEVGSRIKATLSRIYDFFLGLLKKGLEYIKDKASAAKQAMKRDKASKLDEMFKSSFDPSEFMSSSEIKQDAKLNSEGEALAEHFTELLNTLITSATFSASFQTLVEDLDTLTDPLIKKITVIKDGILDIEAHRGANAYRAFASIKEEKPPRILVNFLKLLNVSGSTDAASTINEAQGKILEMHNTQVNIDPFALSKLSTLVEKAASKVQGENALFIFKDDVLDKALKDALAEIETIRKREKIILQSLGDEDSQNTAHVLRGALDIIYRELASITFVVNFADQFFNQLARFARNGAVYLNHCKKK